MTPPGDAAAVQPPRGPQNHIDNFENLQECHRNQGIEIIIKITFARNN